MVKKNFFVSQTCVMINGPLVDADITDHLPVNLPVLGMLSLLDF